MAQVWLDRDDCRYGEFPDVCIKCGADAPDRVKKSFTWIPGWTYFLLLLNLLIFLIVALILQKKIKAQLPMCPRHRNHWLWRLVGTLASIPLLIGCIIALVASAEAFRQTNAEGLVFLGVVALIFGWLVAIIVISATAIRSTTIDDERGLRLAGVCKEFIEAYAPQRRGRRARLPDMDEQTRRWADRRERPRDRDRDERERYAGEDEEPRRRRSREDYDEDY